MHKELKCTKCREQFEEYELLADDLCPYCYGDSFFEREAAGTDDRGYHTNEFGEIIPHAVTAELVDSNAITTEIARSVLL